MKWCFELKEAWISLPLICFLFQAFGADNSDHSNNNNNGLYIFDTIGKGGWQRAGAGLPIDRRGWTSSPT